MKTFVKLIFYQSKSNTKPLLAAMNARSHSIEISCDLSNVTDVAKVLVHSIVFFRTLGKFTYIQDASYLIGTLGCERVDCKQLDFTYVRCSSDILAGRIDRAVEEFTSRLDERSCYGILELDFYTKKAARWPFNETKTNWESWVMKMQLQKTRPPSRSSPFDGGHSEMNIVDSLRQHLLDIVTLVNSERFSVPSMPNQANIDEVFDPSYQDLQPYLFELSYKTSDTPERRGSAALSSGNGSPSFRGGGSPSHRGDGSPSSRGDNYSGFDNGARRTSLQKFLLGTLEL